MTIKEPTIKEKSSMKEWDTLIVTLKVGKTVKSNKRGIDKDLKKRAGRNRIKESVQREVQRSIEIGED